MVASETTASAWTQFDLFNPTPEHGLLRDTIREFVRDHVDARRGIAEHFLLLMLAILVLNTIGTAMGNLALASVTVIAWPLLMLLIVGDLILLGMGLRKALRRRFTTEDTKGAVTYGVLRGTQMRSMRIPKPRAPRGAKV